LDGTCVAAHANPDAGALQCFFLESQLNQPDDPVGEKIHSLGKGTSACAALTVVAEIEISTGTFLYLSGKVGSELDLFTDFS